MNVAIAGLKRQFPCVRNIDTATLDRWLRERSASGSSLENSRDDPPMNEPRKLVLLDVRPAEEFAVSSVPTALRVDPEEKDMERVMRTIQESAPWTATADSDQPLSVVMYCSIGYRSSSLASRLQTYVKAQPEQSPDVSVYNLEGSIFKWANEGRRLQDLSGGETRFVHPYSKIWGLLLDRDRRRYSPL